MLQQLRKNSKKRDAILESIRSTKEHPSAEWVYSQLKPLYPDLSLGTVYRNLAIFREQGDVISVGCFGGQERFDGNVEPHPHFVCEQCNKVIDLDLAFSGLEYFPDVERSVGGTVSGVYVFFTGLCDECLKNRERSR